MSNPLSTDLSDYYNRREADTTMPTRVYLNEPDDLPQGNRRQRRAQAAQKRRKKT